MPSRNPNIRVAQPHPCKSHILLRDPQVWSYASGFGGELENCLLAPLFSQPVFWSEKKLQTGCPQLRWTDHHHAYTFVFD